MARDSVRIEGLDDVLRRLRALGPEASKRGGPVRAAVRKGAVVIANEMKANVRRIVATPNVGGNDESTGMLEKSIKPMRAKAPQKYNGETFFVTVARAARYPVSTKTPSGIGVKTSAQMLEYGTSKRQPMPWARPAFHSKKDEAVKVMTDELVKGIAKLEKKLSKS